MITFTQPQKKIILYDYDSIMEYLDKNNQKIILMDNSTSKKYVKGFNASYIIAKYKLKLIETLLKSEINNDYLQGMKDGKLTLEKEKDKILSKKKSRLQELKKLSSRKKDKEKGL